MDWMTFVSAQTAHLAWPLVVGVLLIIMRKELRGLVRRVTGLKLPGGTEATFGKGLEEARETADELKVPKSGEVPSLPPPEQKVDLTLPYNSSDVWPRPRRAGIDYERLVVELPQVVVLYAYQDVEEVLAYIAPHIDLHESASPSVVITQLDNRGWIDAETVRLFSEVRSLRNLAAHAGKDEITTSQAIEYQDICRRLTEVLNHVLWMFMSDMNAEIRKKRADDAGARKKASRAGN